jgi:hypothetical protein
LSLGQSKFELSKTFLVNHKWKIDKILGLDSTDGEYNLSLAIDTPWFDYGNRIGFNDSMFFSFYTAPCGNDYFTDVVGYYEFLDSNILLINVRRISYHGEWNPPRLPVTPPENWVKLKVFKKEDGYKFVRVL